MSQMMNKSIENPDEDSVSLRSNGTGASNGVVKGTLQTLKRSMRRVSTKKKESKDTSKTGYPSSPPPPSPNVGMSNFGDSLAKKRASLRRSLNFGSKKDGNKIGQQDTTATMCESLVENREEGEDEEKKEEIEEFYNFPKIPDTPLSVMEINKLIDLEVMEEAYMHLLSLRLEFQREREQFVKDSPVELAKKEKDLNLLYKELRNKICSIVRDSNSLPARNKELLIPCARIIQEEEKRAEEPGGLPDSWMEAWRTAVYEGVQVKVRNVHLEQKEQNTSWLAVHLGLLGKAIVEDLEIVKRELRWSYPPSFKVFSTYVQSFNRVVGEHLITVEKQVTELKDLYQLLDWILNRYKSEKIMASLSLQPEITDESTNLQLKEGFLEQLEEKYCCRLKEDMKVTLSKVIELEHDSVWRDRNMPEKEDNFLSSQFPMDIWTKVKGNIINSQKLDADLEHKVISSCFEELKNFPKRFEAEFRHHCSALQPQPRWTEYQITYINSFTMLQEHMDGYQDSCPNEVEEFRKEVKGLIDKLLQGLEDQFKDDVKPFLRRMMTRKWLTNNEDFNHLLSRIKQLSQHSDLMRPPHVHEFVSRLHYHVVREYVGQLMKNNYSCKNRKHEKAAAKIQEQWNQLRDLFEEMNSTHEWLHHVGDDLSNVIGQKNKTDIKSHLQPLVQHYPDFGRKHLVAVLYFRGLVRGREHQLILQQLSVLKRGAAIRDRSQALFGDMQVTTKTECLSGLPFSCLNFLLPDS
ncbi:exocyst complex component 3-like protein 4 isoform X2 [Melanotaenia boesemani]|uniref:exocyst complex component 3-like protein 4 isoform X2 n=1 Tax=Melanotaenia boesemani TaxID=1250792 RepID=UPI001C0424DE|nr:exocyst complex component 3-like protein 4 isoform X2 [Melanotaenia boesemani]